MGSKQPTRVQRFGVVIWQLHDDVGFCGSAGSGEIGFSNRVLTLRVIQLLRSEELDS